MYVPLYRALCCSAQSSAGIHGQLLINLSFSLIGFDWFICYLHSGRSCDYCPSSLYITYSKYFVHVCMLICMYYTFHLVWKFGLILDYYPHPPMSCSSIPRLFNIQYQQNWLAVILILHVGNSAKQEIPPSLTGPAVRTNRVAENAYVTNLCMSTILDTPSTGIMLRSWLWCQSSTNVSPWRLGIWGANPMD